MLPVDIKQKDGQSWLNPFWRWVSSKVFEEGQGQYWLEQSAITLQLIDDPIVKASHQDYINL